MIINLNNQLIKKKKDYKMMPPPPIPKSPSPPIVNPNKGSPHPKKFKKKSQSKIGYYNYYKLNK